MSVKLSIRGVRRFCSFISPKRNYWQTKEARKARKSLIPTRKTAELTQAALAKRLKRPQSFVSKYESGERRLDLVELQEICKAIGVQLIDFVKKFDRF